MERGWTAEVEPLWEDVARDGKGDLHCGHAAHITTDILDAHASVFLVKNEQQQVVKEVSSYFRCRGEKNSMFPQWSYCAARCTPWVGTTRAAVMVDAMNKWSLFKTTEGVENNAFHFRFLAH